VPVDNLEGFTVGVTYFGDMDDLVNPTVVSPDAGGVYRCAACFKNVCCVIVGAGVGLVLLVLWLLAPVRIQIVKTDCKAPHLCRIHPSHGLLYTALAF
jgi:uncharacterized protein (UPF0212 family)